MKYKIRGKNYLSKYRRLARSLPWSYWRLVLYRGISNSWWK